MFRSLFWKEYRQQRDVVFAVILLCGVVELVWYMAQSSMNQYRVDTPFFAIGMFITALFAASSTAIVFSNEHDEKTFGILRNQPITGALVAETKMLWCLFATVLVGLGTLVVSGLMNLIFFNADNSDATLVFGVLGIGVFEAFFWGLFWSTRRKKQIEALLATFFCVAFGSYLSAYFYALFFNPYHPEVPGIYAEAIPLRLLILVPVAIFGVRGAFGWLRKIEPETLPRETVKRRNGPGFLGRSPFGSLCWITIQQSKRLLLYTVVLQGVIAGFFLPEVLSDYFSPIGTARRGDTADQSLYMFMYTLGFASALVFCGSVFWSDQKSGGTKLLIHGGVSPMKIWWSRILVFGAAYLIPATILLLPLVVLSNWNWYTRDNNVFTYEECLQKTRFIGLMLVVLYVSMFCIGQLFSLAIRRGVIAIFCTVGVFFAFVFGWVLFNGIFECSPFWTTIPWLLSLLIASRLHVNDWAKNRNSLRAWRLPLIVIAVPLLCSLIAFPFVRVYSVPILDYGYKMDPAVINEPLNPRKSIWEQMPSDLREFHNVRYALPRIPNGASLELLQQRIKDLSRPNPNRITETNIIRDSYEFDYRRIKAGMGEAIQEEGRPIQFERTIWAFTPWEKSRALRLLNNEFQYVMKMVEEVDQAVFENKNVSLWRRDTELDREILTDYDLHNPWLTQFDRISAIRPLRRFDFFPGLLFGSENQRRMDLLAAGLLAWRLEHGSYPDSLEKLKGTYLDEIPKVPYYDVPYEYRVQPNGKAYLVLPEHPNSSKPLLFRACGVILLGEQGAIQYY